MTGTPGYKDAAGWANLGWVYRNLNKPQESIAAYQKALELDPKQEQAALGLGWAYQYTKEYDKAIAAYNQAIQIDPKDAAAGREPRHRLVLLLQAAGARGARPTPTRRPPPGAASPSSRRTSTSSRRRSPPAPLMTEEQMAKAQAEQQAYEERNKKIESANNALRSRNAATRARAARDIAALAGPNAVPALVVLMQTDPNYDVQDRRPRRPSARSGRPPARPCPTSTGCCGSLPTSRPINATAEQLEAQMKDGDLKRALRDARARIAR